MNLMDVLPLTSNIPVIAGVSNSFPPHQQYSSP